MCFGWDLALVLNHPQRPGLALLLCSPQPLHDSLGSTKVVNLGGTNGTLKGKRFLISILGALNVADRNRMSCVMVHQGKLW